MALQRRRYRRENGIEHRLTTPEFIDPYPWILKTGPEARIFAELVKRHIYFDFQILLSEAVPQTIGDPVLGIKPYRADFLLPREKVVIDPWDDFHHSDPQQAHDDAYKLAVYRAFGFKTYYFWASDIEEQGAAWALNQIPELPGRGSGGYKVWHETDDSAGIRAANAKRRKPPKLELGRRF